MLKRNRDCDRDCDSKTDESVKKRAMLSPHDSVEEHFTCPISQMLVVQPVVAEDGHIYEKKAIEQWIMDCRRKHETMRSPMSNKKIGTKLIELPALRAFVEDAINHQPMDPQTVAHWHFTSGKLKVSGAIPGGLDVAIEHFIKAEQSNPEDIEIENVLAVARMMKRYKNALENAKKNNVDLSCFKSTPASFDCSLHEVNLDDRVSVHAINPFFPPF